MCPLDRNRHFVIAEQGWFIIDESGINEIGLLSLPNGISTRKWQDTFYSLVNLDEKEQISCVYDSTHHLVEISFPSIGNTTADTSWLYDTLGDRVFPAASYGSQAIQSQLVAPSVSDPALGHLRTDLGQDH